jgi:hypothetical protein
MILVFALWSIDRYLGFYSAGRPATAVLVQTLVLVAGMNVFGLQRNLKGQRGIGWVGALVTGTAATTASLIATVLSSSH